MRALRLGRRRFRGRTVLAAVLLAAAAATPARAQFSFFGPSEVSPQDVYDTIAEHGFRLVGPLYRNGRVYLADVIDRRQRRERLVITADNGQIVQRFMVDLEGTSGRREPAVQPAPPRDDSFFSHLTRGWDDDAPPRPPLGLDGAAPLVPQPAPTAPPPRRREPRVVTRTDPTIVPPPGAVTPSPLPPTTPQPSKPDDTARKPDAATVSAPAAPTTAPVRGTTVSTDPLRIPGSRQPDPAKPAPAVASKAAPAPVATPPASSAPAPAAPADVPVAPLD